MGVGDPVQPSFEAYEVLTKAVEDDVLAAGARYINPPKNLGEPAAEIGRKST